MPFRKGIRIIRNRKEVSGGQFLLENESITRFPNCPTQLESESCGGLVQHLGQISQERRFKPINCKTNCIPIGLCRSTTKPNTSCPLAMKEERFNRFTFLFAYLTSRIPTTFPLEEILSGCQLVSACFPNKTGEPRELSGHAITSSK